MKPLSQEILALPFEERALLALRSAVKKAITENHRRGIPVYIWSNGKVVRLRPKPKPAQRKPVRAQSSPPRGRRPANQLRSNARRSK